MSARRASSGAPRPSGAAWYALEQTVWYAYVAIRSVIHFHLGDRIGTTLDARIQQMVDDYKALQAAFVQRWGNEDPFPGQWAEISKPSRRGRNQLKQLWERLKRLIKTKK